MLDLAISIINYKTKDLTEKCLNSIIKSQPKVNYQIWLVDNGSFDGSAQYLKQKFTKLNFIQSDKNLGFAKGHNLSLNQIKAKYILILNSDTQVSDGVIDGMVDFMDQHPQAGIASCKVLGFDGKLQPNGGDLPVGTALFNWLLNLEIVGLSKPSFHRNEESYYRNEREVGWVSGNFMVIRQDVINKIGLLNEKYFMYFEDTDYCYKAKQAGFKIMFNPNLTIKHLSGGSLKEPRFRQWLGEYQGLNKFYSQNFGFLTALFIKAMIYFAITLRIIAFALTGNFDYSKTYAKVLINF